LFCSYDLEIVEKRRASQAAYEGSIPFARSSPAKPGPDFRLSFPIDRA
jgi:hypothetical protein